MKMKYCLSFNTHRNKDTPCTSTQLETDKPAAEEQQNNRPADSDQPQIETEGQDADNMAAASASGINLKWNVIGSSPYKLQRIASAAIVQGS